MSAKLKIIKTIIQGNLHEEEFGSCFSDHEKAVNEAMENFKGWVESAKTETISNQSHAFIITTFMYPGVE